MTTGALEQLVGTVDGTIADGTPVELRAASDAPNAGGRSHRAGNAARPDMTESFGVFY